MKVIRLFTQVIIIAVIASSCATGTISVRSKPETAEIYAIDAQGVATSLGQTPLTLSADRVFGNNSRTANLMVKADKYLPQSLVLHKPVLAAALDVTISLDSVNDYLKAQGLYPEAAPLPPVAAEKECPSINELSFAELAQGVAEAQTLIKNRDFKRAETTINILLVRYPFVSVLHDLAGNVHYLMGDPVAALARYEESLKINGENMNTRAMITRLRGVLDQRQSGGG